MDKFLKQLHFCKCNNGKLSERYINRMGIPNVVKQWGLIDAYGFISFLAQYYDDNFPVALCISFFRSFMYMYPIEIENKIIIRAWAHKSIVCTIDPIRDLYNGHGLYNIECNRVFLGDARRLKYLELSDENLQLSYIIEVGNNDVLNSEIKRLSPMTLDIMHNQPDFKCLKIVLENCKNVACTINYDIMKEIVVKRDIKMLRMLADRIESYYTIRHDDHDIYYNFWSVVWNIIQEKGPNYITCEDYALLENIPDLKLSELGYINASVYVCEFRISPQYLDAMEEIVFKIKKMIKIKYNEA